MSSKGVPGRDGRLAVQFLESGIANQNALSGVNYQQTIGECSKNRTHFGRVFRDLAVEFALTNQQLLQSQANPAGLRGTGQEKGARLFATPNSR